jgi:hypothetical protein
MTSTGTFVCDNSSLENFKNWGMAISSAFATFGWVQTADTGQVNWSTISTVPNGYVYEVWKANDAQAATLPIYVKAWYGNISAVVVSFAVTVGTGSDGAGTITGAISFNQQVVNGNGLVSGGVSGQGSTPLPCYFSGDAGEIRMLLWTTNTSASSAFGIERSKDATGAKTAQYFTCLFVTTQASTTNIGQQTTLNASSVANRENTLISTNCSSGMNTGLFGAQIAVFPIFPLFGQLGNPMLGWMSACAADVTNNTTVNVLSMYGSTHTYFACKDGPTNGSYQNIGTCARNGAFSAVLMRFE